MEQIYIYTCYMITVLGLWCHVDWHRVTSILEECTAFIIRIEVETPGSSKMLVPVYLTIQNYIPEDQTCNQEFQCGSKYG